MSGLPPPTCEVDQWVVAEAAKRQRTGETVNALLVGIGQDEQALRLAETGARVLLLSDREPFGHVNVVQSPVAHLFQADAEFPLQPFDLIVCQRALCSLRYTEARATIRNLLGRLKIGGRFYVSLYGIHSELGEQYADGGKLVNERHCPLTPALAERYKLPGPVCLYSERNLFSLLMEAGGAVLKTSTSALGHVRGVAARI